jgi:hypothetical protein
MWRSRIPHEKLFVSGEGHGMGHLKNQIELYSRIEAFLPVRPSATPMNYESRPSRGGSSDLTPSKP